MWINHFAGIHTRTYGWIVYIGVLLSAKLSATATRDSHYCACLDHLGWSNTDSIISISVALPNFAKASTSVSLSHAVVADVIALNLANVNTALGIIYYECLKIKVFLPWALD